ncbi:MAG TPA: hypothetical protein VKP68_11245 [Ramlibacter sp.]|nr:hypothetical protein [Ramlibacter sp.]
MAQPGEPNIVKNLAAMAASGAEAGKVADAAAAAWAAVDGALSPIIGRRGVVALYKRSIHLAQEGYPWLVAAYEGALRPGDFDSLRAALSQQTAQDAAAAHDAVLKTFRGLLDNLIGGSLTQRLLQTVPDQPSGGDAVQDNSP